MESNFCSECGAQLKEEDRFCPECGYNISEDYNSVSETPKPVESQGYYNLPMEEYDKDSSTPEESLYEPDVSLDEQEVSLNEPEMEEYEPEESLYKPEMSLNKPGVSLDETGEKEFDPFKQNADAKTTIYDQHSRQSRNMLLLGLVVILALAGIIFLVISFLK